MTKAEKIIDRRVTAAYSASCHGIQVNIMDTPKIYKVGKEAALRGATDEELRTAIRAFVDTLKVA